MNNNAMVTVPEKTQSLIDGLDQWAVQVKVTTDLQRESVLGVVKDVKKQKKELNELFNPNIKQAHDLHKSLVAQKRTFTDRLDAAEKAGKNAVITYDQEQEQIRLKEERRLQAIEDAKAQREKERLRKEADNLKTPELAEARREEAESVVASVVQVAAPQKAKGVATKKTWKARVVDVTLVPREYMLVNQKALDGLARNTKGTMKIDGVEFYVDSSLAIR